MANVRFFGPFSSRYSGYGNAVKNFALAFHKSGIKTKYMFEPHIVQKNPYMAEHTFSKKDKFIDFYLHCPPWSKHKTNAEYRIGYFYWEADRLPPTWVKSLKQVNEIWAPCELVKSACLRANFKGKIRIVPTPSGKYSTNKFANIVSPFSDDYIVSDDVFKFYSIFQWQERKGYRELLVSYFREFSKSDNVILILKVNALNISGFHENKIIPDILSIKNKLGPGDYPPIFIITRLIPEEQLYALHNIGDCYISPHHGEGWGMPIHDAMRFGKQIITTKYGGVTEHLNDESAHIIRHKLGPVSNMVWSPLYNKNQNWAHPSIQHLQFLMRNVYENYEEYSHKSKNAKIIADKMTIDEVAKIIKSNIGSIRS